jgi:hypothetical protein
MADESRCTDPDCTRLRAEVARLEADLRRIRAAWPVRCYRRLARLTPALRRLVQ